MPNNFKSHSIILRTAKTSSATRLSYTERPLDRAQARFVDRTVMDPELDLARFTCTAVIDWLDVLIMVQRPTQFQWLQEEIYRAVGRRCLVEPLEDDAFPKGTIYRIRFQEPRLATVWAAVDAVAARFGIQMVPPMMGMEVSVDFTPKEHSDELRRQLMGVLVRHHFPGMDVLATKRGRPRCAWGKNGNHRFVLPFSQKPGVTCGRTTTTVRRMSTPASTWAAMPAG
jgi:hypothetical protein